LFIALLPVGIIGWSILIDEVRRIIKKHPIFFT
jgi:hypothetical protein